MKRREFITLLGGAAVWSLPVGAQQSERMRCIGVLMSLAADDSETQARHAAFLQGLQQLGLSKCRRSRHAEFQHIKRRHPRSLPPHNGRR